MLRLKALGSRRLLESVKEDARRPTEASATSTRGMRAIFSGPASEEMPATAEPAFADAVVEMGGMRRYVEEQD